MFESISAAPPDSILGLNEAFAADPAPHKINLGVGVFKDSRGVTPILSCVKEAEQRLVEQEKSKSYLSIQGDAGYLRHVSDLLFGSQLDRARVAAVQTPGGTGALRVAGDFIKRMLPSARIWMSTPTWANHPSVFEASGVETEYYAYFNPETNALDFPAMQDSLRSVAAGDIVLLHGCCHNPTGVDFSLEQWRTIGQLLADHGAVPLVDFAYQGFADGLEQDAEGLRSLLSCHNEMLVCNSFSKNFGLYRERVGALVAVSSDADTTGRVLSQLKKTIRTNYSNPPAHGAAIVTTVLNDTQLTQLWHEELKAMRDRINGTRRRFVEMLAATGINRDFQFIQRQRGMFSFSGLSTKQVARLRDEFSIYIVGSGRINVAGITEENVGYLCESMARII